MTLKTGDLAYFDSFAGLVPCKIIAMTGRSGIASTAQEIVLRLTARRGAYRRGEVVLTTGLHAVPRGAVRGNRIRPYQVEVSGHDA
jgi:hypothetical protein